MIIKIIAGILAVILMVGIGYMLVNSVIELFNGHGVGEAISISWNNLTHLWGIIKDAKADNNVLEYPFTNVGITC